MFLFAASLLKFLEQLGFDVSDRRENVPNSKSIHKFVTETLVKQMYLKREKVTLESSALHERIQYSWGVRAEHEFPKKDMLKKVAKVIAFANHCSTGILMFRIFISRLLMWHQIRL